MNHPVRAFVRHYLEMVVAMLLGMLVLYPMWSAATSGATGWLTRPETDALAMATAMAVPMAVWMKVRGHSAAANLEMTSAMYAGFVVLFPFVWVGAMTGADMIMLGHVLMLVFMLVAMLARRPEYAGRGHAHRRSQIQPWSRATR